MSAKNKYDTIKVTGCKQCCQLRKLYISTVLNNILYFFGNINEYIFCKT